MKPKINIFFLFSICLTLLFTFNFPSHSQENQKRCKHFIVKSCKWYKSLNKCQIDKVDIVECDHFDECNQNHQTLSCNFDAKSESECSQLVSDTAVCLAELP